MDAGWVSGEVAEVAADVGVEEMLEGVVDGAAPSRVRHMMDWQRRDQVAVNPLATVPVPVESVSRPLLRLAPAERC